MHLIAISTENTPIRIVRAKDKLYRALGGSRERIQQTVELALSGRDGHEEAKKLLDELMELDDYPIDLIEVAEYVEI